VAPLVEGQITFCVLCCCWLSTLHITGMQICHKSQKLNNLLWCGVNMTVVLFSCLAVIVQT